MSKARNISNIFSGATDSATDAEVTAAIAVHASNTETIHWSAKQTIVSMIIGSKGGLNEIKVIQA